MTPLEQYLDTIDSYAMVGEWSPEVYDEAVRNFLQKRFGELFEQEVEVPTCPDIAGRDL